MDGGGRRRAIRIGAAAVVALLIAAGAVFALTRSDDNSPVRSGPREQALAVQQSGIEACLETGLPEETCASLASDASVEPRATTEWCKSYGQLIEASAGLALLTDPDVDRAPLVKVVRSASAEAQKTAPREVAKDMAASARALDAVLDAYESAGARGDLSQASAAVAPDVHEAARAASDRIATYTRGHCG